MEIKEIDKLIAIFMDLGEGPNYIIKEHARYLCNNKTEYLEDYFNIDELEYSKNWQWLIPVVEKIESINDDIHGFIQVHINGNNCTINGTNLWKQDDIDTTVYYNDTYGDTKLLATYEAVGKFIIWYNNYKKINK